MSAQKFLKTHLNSIAFSCTILLISVLLLGRAFSKYAIVLSSSANTGALLHTFTLTELDRHSLPTDCYIAFDGNVYDITWYLPLHPGGKDIVSMCGEVTDEFSKVHPGGEFTRRATQMVLEKSKVGRLE